MTKKEEANKEELVINTVHNKVNKDDIYLIGIMKKLLTELEYYIFDNSYKYGYSGQGFGMFILKNEEKYLFKESKLSNIYLNYYKNNQGAKNGRTFEYELNDEYTLMVYCLGYYKNEINKIMKSNILTLQSVFRDKNLKVFQQKLVDIFGLYGSLTTILMLFHYLNHEVFYISGPFGSGSVKKNIGKYGEGDITIDISILERIIQEGKERFQDKLDLLYLLFSNINKRPIKHACLSLFFDFLEEGIEKFKIKEKNIEEQELDGEFQTYTIKMQYLCSYIFKEFFDDYVHGGSKRLISFYDWERREGNRSLCIYDGEDFIEKYKKFDIDYLKKVALIVDQKLYKKYS